MPPKDPDEGARVPRKTPSAAWQKIGGEVILLNVDGKELLGLNGVGGRVWQLIDGARTITQLISEVASAFPDVPHDQIATDVTLFLEELQRENMITV